MTKTKAGSNKNSKAVKKAVKKTVTKSAKKSVKSNKSKLYPRVECNPYRDGSGYSICFDILHKLGLKKPIQRSKIIEEYAEATGKDIATTAKWDVSVVLSPRNNGKAHRSSKGNAYWVERLEDSFVQLVMQEETSK